MLRPGDSDAVRQSRQALSGFTGVVRTYADGHVNKSAMDFASVIGRKHFGMEISDRTLPLSPSNHPD